jgi:hypothetical protein
VGDRRAQQRAGFTAARRASAAAPGPALR